MSDRITSKDVRNAFRIYCETAQRVGYYTEGWTLGKQSFPFRITGKRSDDSTLSLPGLGLSGMGGDWIIGSSYRDAYDALRGASKAWNDMLRDHKESNGTDQPLYEYKVSSRNGYHYVTLMYDIKRDGSYTEIYNDNVIPATISRKAAQQIADRLNWALNSNPYQVRHNDPNQKIRPSKR